MTKRTSFLLSLAFCALTAGCSGGTFIVKKNPTDNDEGFRYYLPKPYLLVSNKEEVVDGKKILTRDTRIIYLPDPAEKYSIDVEGGTAGSFKGSLELENGWNLTKVNQEYDTKTAETISSLASLIKEVKPGFFAQEVRKEEVEVKSFELYEIDLINRKLIPIPIKTGPQGTQSSESKLPGNKLEGPTQ